MMRWVDQDAAGLRVLAPGKLNLALSIGSVITEGERNGMHPIASWMVGVEVFDEVHLTRLDMGEASGFEIVFADDALAKREVDWPIEKDLAVRAHDLLEKQTHQRLPVDATVLKRIPTGAGMGGGSSDAAAMLVGLNVLFELGLNLDALMQIGLQLGSDVGFAVQLLGGEPWGLVAGFGDEIEMFKASRVWDVCLVLPSYGCPTGAVYGTLDASGWVGREVQMLGVQSLMEGAGQLISLERAETSQVLFNDLEKPASKVQPKLGQLLQTLRGEMRLDAHVTGSGSGIFILMETREQAMAIAERIRMATNESAVAVRTLG